MQHLVRCPACGVEIDLDEQSYVHLLSQVRTKEFYDEISQREQLIRKNSDLAVDRIKQEYMSQIMELQSQQKLLKAEADSRLNTMRQEFDARLRMKEEEVAYYKDFKAKQSTKMVGESLEQHCMLSFEKYRSAAFPHAYFARDNDASSGSKGDFIFRDYTDDGMEYISIMFEMKNETDTTSTKHKNEDFLKELNKDRVEKNCEYAVLVSLLEPDSELYNTGIVDVSHRYPRMYVIRPQFFVPMITMLRNAAANSVGVMRELERIRSEQVDVVRFESDLDDFKQKFGRNCDLAGRHFEDAIDEIDKIIARLQKTRDSLALSFKNVRIAGDRAGGLSIKKLVRDNLTVERMFEKAGDSV